MFTKIRSDVVIVAAMLAMLAWSSHLALAQQLGSGIWVYYTGMSIALINLTNSPLTFKQLAPLPEEGGCRFQPLLNISTNISWQVEPYRTKTWSSTADCFDAGLRPVPRHYEGTVTLYTPNLPACKAFDLVFKKQQALDAGPWGQRRWGTWVGLSPSYTYEGPDTGWKDWWKVNDWGYGRWATSYTDFKMHNVMTLIGSTCMVALYSADNTNLVVVVQQYYQQEEENLEVPLDKPIIWNDRVLYPSYVWDFVDNDDDSIPGQGQ